VKPKTRILLVDDEAALTQAFAEQLRLCGFEVDTAHNGADALALARSRDYDAVVCDVLMPIMDGQQMYEQLRAYKPALTERFIFMTGMVSLMGSVSQKFMRSADADLRKPFTFTQLLGSLSKVIPRSHWPAEATISKPK
jgi:DNA-binding response OmpR family regulator